jgi:hypothetical protein
MFLFCASGFIFVTENSALTTGGQIVDILDAFYFMIIVRNSIFPNCHILSAPLSGL